GAGIPAAARRAEDRIWYEDDVAKGTAAIEQENSQSRRAHTAGAAGPRLAPAIASRPSERIKRQ
ncbi:hypothetical protein L7Q78_34815, partial [Achromobacter xylosoxidans]|nr:hypothetical protein [Achromobacter xylosoxidans]